MADRRVALLSATGSERMGAQVAPVPQGPDRATISIDLAIAQIAIAQALLLCTGLSIHALREQMRVPLGFEPKNVVVGSVLGGYMPHGDIRVLWQPLEVLIILGSAIGGFIISNPKTVLFATAKHFGRVLKGSPYHKKDYLELMDGVPVTQPGGPDEGNEQQIASQGDASGRIAFANVELPDDIEFTRNGKLVKKIVGFNPEIRKELDAAVEQTIAQR